ncbi:glycosyltransferase, partial [Microgenomates group bacterium]|nr:glycosyltransferase [Microgenomates group bacterium]
MPNISVIISTFNGLKLLQKNLASVVEAASEMDEIVIADDKSSDLTVPHFIHQYDLELIEENEDYKLYQNIFYWEKKQLTLTLVANQKNLRFGANNNLAVRLAKHELVFILNNDCRPQKKCLKQLADHFENGDKDLFAVTCFEKTTQKDGEYQYHGKNKLWWQRGRFIHGQFEGDPEKWKKGETAWAGGGSSLFDKKKFLALGGFDSLFYPAYWEDIDLSWQAKKMGYKILFDPSAVVIHDHETTNKSVFGQKKMADLAWKNGSRFIKKNASLKQKIASLLWSPYWIWKRHQFGCVLALLILLTIITRFYKLGSLPSGMTWDEAAIGYNGWSIWQTRRDEWLEKLPLAFKSFGDYKAPLAIYISGLFTSLIGLTPLAVRLPFAMAGVMAVWGMVLLLKELLIATKSKYPHKLSLLGGFIFAFTPWSFMFSRTGFESGMALCFIIWAGYLILNCQRTSRKYTQKWWQFGLATTLIAAAMYVYHSSKITAPLILLLMMVLWWRK